MFCSNCGRKCDDNVKFCPECGYSIKNNSNVQSTISNPLQKGQMTNENMKKVLFLLLMVGSVVLSALGAFLPCISAKIDYFFDDYTREFNMSEMFDLLELVEDYGASVGGYKFLFIVCIVLSIVIGIVGIKMIYDVFSGEKGEKLTDSANAASGFCVVRFLIIVMNVFAINKATGNQLWGAEFLSVSLWAWITVICAVICMSVFSRFYLENCEKEEVINTRICKKCGTSFEIGEVCPKCGTKISC